jgi:NAD:arginine ADP-ribosyltransferase
MGDEAYRGVNLSDVDHYEHGLVFRWPFFISASQNRSIATAFGKTLVIIEVPGSANVRDISYSSLFPGEGEVLFRAYEVFEVLEASPSEIRIRVFHDEWFGTGWEITEQRELKQIE